MEGVYAGDGSNPGVRERVESSDLILSIGAIKSDFNTAVSAITIYIICFGEIA